MTILKDFLAGAQSVLHSTGASTPLTEKSISGVTTSTFGGVGVMESSGFAIGGRELIAAFQSSPNLRKVVNLIANRLTATPFYLRKRTSKSRNKAWPIAVRSIGQQGVRKAATASSDLVWDHEFLDFLQRGAPGILPGPPALKTSYAYKEIKGEFFWHLMSTSGARTTKPTSYLVVPPQWVERLPCSSEDFYLLSRGHEIEGSRKVSPERMFWVKDPNLSDLYGRGSGIGDALADELDSDEYAAGLLRHLVANKGFKDTLISIRPDAGASAEMAAQVEAKYNQRHRGMASTGRAMVIDGAQIDVRPLTHDLGELKLLDLRRFEAEIIHQTWGIPPELFGQVSNSNRATIDAAEAILAKNVLVPRLEAMRLALQLQVLPLFDPAGQYILDYVSPVPEDKARRLDVMRAQPSAYTKNEWRAETGHEATSWGETLGGLDMQTAAPIEEPAKSKSLLRRDLTGDEIDVLLAKIDSSELALMLSPDWRMQLTATASTAFNAFPGAVGSFDLVNPLVAEHVTEFGGRWVKDIDATTKTLLGRTLAEGLDAGEGINALSNRVREQMGLLRDGSRAELIARTEAVRSANAARQMGWQATGLALKKRWISALSSKTRESHAALHDSVVSVKEHFTFSGSLDPGIMDSVKGPGQSSYAAHSCNCLCTMVAFDPEHKSADSVLYGGESHVELCRAFENELPAWEAIILRRTDPYYAKIEKAIIQELNRLV